MTVKSPLRRDFGIVTSVTPFVPVSPCTVNDSFFPCSSNLISLTSDEFVATWTLKSLPPALIANAFGLTTTNLADLSKVACVFNDRVLRRSALTSPFTSTV